MDIRYTKPALKALQGYDKPTRDRILKKIQGLAQAPPQGDIRPLEGKINVYRLRVGDFRVLYTVEPAEQTIVIDKIAPRGQAYKD